MVDLFLIGTIAWNRTTICIANFDWSTNLNKKKMPRKPHREKTLKIEYSFTYINLANAKIEYSFTYINLANAKLEYSFTYINLANAKIKYSFTYINLAKALIILAFAKYR